MGADGGTGLELLHAFWELTIPGLSLTTPILN